MHHRCLYQLVACTCWIVCSFGLLARAGDIQLLDGTIIPGRPVPIKALGPVRPSANDTDIDIFTVTMVEHHDAIRYFVPSQRVVNINRDIDILNGETFKLQQNKTNQSRVVHMVGSVLESTPYSEFGRRRLSMISGNKSVDVLVGIIQVTPHFSKVSGLNYGWEFSVPTNSIPAETLSKMLLNSIDRNDQEPRLAVFRLFLESGNYQQAQAELDQLLTDFPNLKEKLDGFGLELRQLQAQQILDELRVRIQAGQHKLVYERIQQFPERDISGSLLQEVREIRTNYETQLEVIQFCNDLLSRLQAELPEEMAAQVAPCRQEIQEQLNPASLDRLASFRNLAIAEGVNNEEKLGLAISGWLLGADKAVPELETALRLWESRRYILEYLKTDLPRDHSEIIARFSRLDGVGPEQIAQMLTLLPPIIEMPDLKSLEPMELTVDTGDGEAPVRYHVILPVEYNAQIAYPVILALRNNNGSAVREAQFWSGTPERPGLAASRGYITIAPEYATPEQREYDYSAAAHRIVMTSLRDAQKRFHIDSNRIFLSGHGMGANATFEIGMSHPGEFAGIIPIGGSTEKFCKFYWANLANLPTYVVQGELDRDQVQNNIRELNRMMQKSFPLIYAEYIGYGQAPFESEIPRIIDWMSRQKRATWLREFEVKTARKTDSQFFWCGVGQLPERFMVTVYPMEPARLSPISLKVFAVESSNVITILGGAKAHSLALSPELVDYARRLRVKINGIEKFNDFPKPEIKTMLDHFRSTGDRQRTVWTKIAL